MEIFERAEVTAAPVYDIDQFMADPHVIAREILVDLPDAEIGRLPMHNIIPRLSATPGRLRRPAPALGEHTAEILGSLGLDRAEIEGLAREGIIASRRRRIMTAASLPVWRSLLFVPVTAKRFVDGAARRGADAIILDLEDSVAASEKERARTLVPEAAEIVSRGGADVVVRINRPLRLAVRDIEAAVGPRRIGVGPPQGG